MVRRGLSLVLFGLALQAPGVALAQSDPDARALLEVIAKAGCRECHNPNGVASDTRLVFPEFGTPAASINEQGGVLLELVDVKLPEKSRLLRKPTKRMLHEGGQKIAPGSADEQVLRAWIAELARSPRAMDRAVELLTPAAPVASIPAERGAFRRLTAAQYDNTVRDVLGDIVGPSRQFPPEDFVDGFKNQYQAQSTSPVLTEAYNAAAQRLAADVTRPLRVQKRRAGVLTAPPYNLPCRTTDAGAAGACRDGFIRELGKRLFRRPVNEAEVSRYAALFLRAKDFTDGVQVVVETMLQSPNFLYLIEPAEPAQKPYARAARLAYFLWNTTPDDALMASAAVGALATPDGLERVVAGMIADPKTIPAMDEFVAQWLRLDRVRGTFKDRSMFPEFTTEVGAAMAEETRRFVDDLIWSDRDFTALFTANHTFASGELAGLYGLAARPAGGFEQVSYAADGDRSGILGQGSFLTGTSKPADTSPTARGLFVREHFLCQTLPPPPPGVNMNLPPIDPRKPLTNRERLRQHLTDESCARCHNLIDSIGFGLEKFDAIGRRQEMLRVPLPRVEKGDKAEPAPSEPPRPIELPLDTTGAIAGLKQSTFSTARQIGAILASSAQCQRCIVKQLFRYAVGRPDSPGDGPALDRIFAEFRASGFHFKRLMMAVAKWTELLPATPPKS